MHKIIKTIALFLVLGSVAVSCQKENIIQENIEAEQCQTMYTVSYTIDGENYLLTLVGDDSWHDFLDRMFTLAENGHKVSFHKEETTTRALSAKEMIKHTTYDREDAYQWAEKMGRSGYTVTIDYDKRTGLFTCYAIN